MANLKFPQYNSIIERIYQFFHYINVGVDKNQGCVDNQ